MIPIKELLSRFRWDPDFGRGEIELAYFDRVENGLILVPLRQIEFSEDAPNAFKLTDAEGVVHWVPFHRLREVHKNGERIWHNP